MPPNARGNPDDESLLRAVRAGESEAIATWYRREHPEVYRLAVGFLAQAEEAEDLAQDAMMHLLDRLPGWRHERSYRAWRNTVVANLCRDRLRRLATRQRHEQDLQPAATSTAADPEHTATQAEIRAVLAGALRQLTPREREVFVLRDLEGCSAEETATILDIRAGTVRSLLSLARRRLRHALGSELVEFDR